jgi:F-box protein 11
VSIFDNRIFDNIFQGILITEHSSAHVERNEIIGNIKANIALGGDESCNTNIINNKILKGRCEGIFMIDCGKCLIMKNEIKGNYFGILSISSIPIVQDNTIVKSKSHAILATKKSKVIILNNTLKDNLGVGVFLRDDSCTHMRKCTVEGNVAGYVQERKYNPKKHERVGGE